MSERACIGAAPWLRRAAVLVFLSSGSAVPACRSSASREFEAEAASLGLRIDALRNAPNESKKPFLEALSGASCQAEPLCRLKALCTDAYATHVGALDASARVKVLLQRPDGGAEAALEAAAELQRAEQGLERARLSSERCAREQGRIALEARAR